MAGFIEGADRRQALLLREYVDDYVDAESIARVIDAFVDMLDLAAFGFATEPEASGRPGDHPGFMLRIYLSGYLNQVQSSWRLERECRRNLELIWLTGRLAPDFKTIADFRKDNGPAIRKVCREFAALCRDIHLLDSEIVAIDGGRFKAVNAKAKNFTREKLRRKLGEIDAAIERYLGELDRADALTAQIYCASAAFAHSAFRFVKCLPRQRKPSESAVTVLIKAPDTRAGVSDRHVVSCRADRELTHCSRSRGFQRAIRGEITLVCDDQEPAMHLQVPLHGCPPWLLCVPLLLGD
jgi:transposase